MTDVQPILPPEMQSAGRDIFHPTWINTADLSHDDYSALFAWVQIQAAASRWWMGDLLVFGDTMYGNEFWQHVDSERHDPSDLAVLLDIANTYPPADRREDLSWEHHRVAAKYVKPATPAERSRWLARAAEAKWSVGDFVKHLRDEIVDVEEAEPPVEPKEPKTHSTFRVSIRVAASDAGRVEPLMDVIESDARSTIESSGVVIEKVETARSDS